MSTSSYNNIDSRYGWLGENSWRSNSEENNITSIEVDSNEPTLATLEGYCLLSLWDLNRYNMAINVYVLGILCLLGILGNLLTIVVLNRDDEKPKTTRFLLQTLATVDGFYLVVAVFVFPVDNLLRMRSNYQFTIEPYLRYVQCVAETSAVWMVLPVTVDRYLAVCRPWKVEWKELRRAKFAVAVVLVSAFLYGIPELITSFSYLDQHRYNSRYYRLIYHVICYTILRAVGPLLTLIVLNGRLFREVLLMRKRHLDLTQRQAQPDNITLILVVIVTVFLVCQLPTVALRIATAIGIFNDCSLIKTYVILLFVSNAFFVCNSSVNFVIYCLVGTRFRQILVRMIRCWNPENTIAYESDNQQV